MGEEDKYKFEVQVNQADKAFTGVTYSYRSTVFYGKATCSGTLNKHTKKVLLEELKLIELKTTSGVSPCIMTCFLQYSKVDGEEFLEGTYTSMNTADSSNCGRGTVFLRKVENSDFYKEPFLTKKEKPKTSISKTPAAETNKPQAKTVGPATNAAKVPPSPKTAVVKAPAPSKSTAGKPTIPKTKTPAVPTPQSNQHWKPATDSLHDVPSTPRPSVILPQVLSSRANELVRTITTGATEISINIYDNGSIDNDTVSVYLDKKLVVSKQRLTENPIVVKFSMDNNADEHELIMVAENLGEIPPNTSLMVVNAGDQQYEVRITSTEQKNAVVIFKYKKE